MIDAALRDPDNLAEVAVAIEDQHQAYALKVVGGPIMDMLSWVIENREAIIELIKALIGLFGEPPTAADMVDMT